MALAYKDLRHARYYFISKPLPDNSPPPIIHNNSELITFHYAQCPALEGYNIICGYAHFQQRFTPEDLERFSGCWYQWIPAVFAHQYSQDIGVDFRSWQKEDFDMEAFVKKTYPWDNVSDLLYQYFLALPSRQTHCPDCDSILITL